MTTDIIEKITPYVIPAEPIEEQWWARKAYVLVRVETREGVIGWGECHLLTFRENSIVAMIKRLAEWIVGRPVHNIRDIAQDMFNNFGQRRPSVEVYSAFAGIEIALWDILGKQFNAPIYQLLGGACHKVLPVYANMYSPGTHPPEAYADVAANMVAMGHSRIKLYPFTAQTTIEEGIAILEAVHDVVGPDVGLAVDLWGHANPARALQLARAMEPYDLLWIEDPFAPTDAASIRYLRDAMTQPLLTGETLPTRREFVELFERRAVDVINPDICLSGILEILAIASLAEVVNISLSPHNSNSMALGTSAAIHASAGIRNLGPIEYFPLFESALDDVCNGRVQVVSGEVSIPELPGLGVIFDDDAMTRYQV
ncbi:MAG: mandelate racemase/muconate lactonizing enzyme family protein [Pseudomonadota bacterium]